MPQRRSRLIPGCFGRSDVNYPALSEIVEATRRDFGVSYHSYPSLGAGIAAHYRWLRTLGPDYSPQETKPGNGSAFVEDLVVVDEQTRVK